MKNGIKGLTIFCLILLMGGVFLFGETAKRDDFLKGYLTSILEREFSMEDYFLRVDDGRVFLTIYGEEEVNTGKVKKILSEIEGVREVDIKHERRGKKEVREEKETAQFLPRKGVFRSLISDPRFPHFSASYFHCSDNPEFENLAATSFGETFLLFKDHAPFHSKWDIGLQAGVFAIFDLDAESLDLINADYLVAIPVGYRRERFSALFRVLHQSSHLGDEYLLSRNIERVNFSYESVDFKLSYDLRDVLRFYGGGAYMISKEPKELEPLSYQYGVEYRSLKSFFGEGIVPIAGADFKIREENNWDTDVSLRAGFRLENSLESNRVISFLLEYFDGHSPNGQFYGRSIEYMGFGIHFYF